MTEIERLERNENIALMLGYVNTTPEDKDFNIYEHQSKTGLGVIPSMIEAMSMRFHSDWNWVMEAIGFINKIDFTGDLLEMKRNLICIQINSDIDYVFKLVSDFAKSFNEKKS
jgi:hypothetical protein